MTLARRLCSDAVGHRLGDAFVPAARAVEVLVGFEITDLRHRDHAAALGDLRDRRVGVLDGENLDRARAAGYLFYAALSHLVWSEASPHGRGWPIGLLQALGLSAVGALLLRRAT